MRGAFEDQGGLFSYISPEARVPPNHPLRKIREFVREVLSELNRSLGKLYASEGRPSIPPEQLLSALLLQVFYGIRSERQLMEQLDYNLLYRWFVGLSPDEQVWDPTTFTKNRDRLQNGEVFAKFMSKLPTTTRAGLTWLLEISRRANTLCGQELRQPQRAQVPSETKAGSGPPKPSASSQLSTNITDGPLNEGRSGGCG